MEKISRPIFAPQLYIKSGIRNIDFYEKALGAIELRRITNEDSSIHVAELSINGTIFHLHEETSKSEFINPERNGGTTVILGLFVNDVDEYMENALAAGSILVSPAQDYDYGYRQGQIKDPFGHVWMFEKKI